MSFVKISIKKNGCGLIGLSTYSSKVVSVDVLNIEILVFKIEEVSFPTLGEVIVKLGKLACHVYSFL